MSHDVGQTCACRADHAPAPLELNYHHIWPKEYGGPSTLDNMVWICPTTHTNVHEILREIVKRDGALTWTDALAFWDRPVSRYAFNLAHEGWRRWKAA